MIIDVHGHYTTAPEPLGVWREAQVGALDGGQTPDPAGPRISDDQIRESLEANQLAQMDTRGIDLTVFSPRASFMAHHLGDLATSTDWARICNDLCARVADLYPQRFAPAAMLPQSPGVDPATVVGELKRAVTDLGAVAVNLNPDPSGGHWTAPPLTDRSWYPVYEKLVELDVPAMVHVSTSCNPAFHTTGAHYLNADTTAFMQLLQGDLFADLPDLRLVIPHGGGAVPYHWGRFRGLAQALGRPDPEEMLGTNVFFDTCVYHQPGVDLLLDVVPQEGVLFASEMIGAVRGVDPRTGHHFDDTRRYVERHAAARSFDDAQVRALFEGNARRVYPRLGKRLADQGR
ncbi:MAG TPA: amidohydrolase family protein [Isoptericola sp.]|nr:amidohydrolase family protein [Isoptericola sp.]